eukprot:1140920-Pelagomonas_calceolata.AAC.1
MVRSGCVRLRQHVHMVHSLAVPLTLNDYQARQGSMPRTRSAVNVNAPVSTWARLKPGAQNFETDLFNAMVPFWTC